MGIRGGFLVNSKAQSAEVSAVVLRADGTVVRLGTVAYWHKNPLRRLLWRLKQLLKGNGHG